MAKHTRPTTKQNAAICPAPKPACAPHVGGAVPAQEGAGEQLIAMCKARDSQRDACSMRVALKFYRGVTRQAVSKKMPAGGAKNEKKAEEKRQKSQGGGCVGFYGIRVQVPSFCLGITVGRRERRGHCKEQEAGKGAGLWGSRGFLGVQQAT